MNQQNPRDLRAHWIDNRSPRLLHESIWLVAQKFAYLNGPSAKALRAALRESLRRPDSEFTASARKSVSRKTKTGPVELDRAIVTPDMLRVPSLDDLFGMNVDWICELDRIRYCPECMDQWFHSSLFQVCGVQVCPFHRLPLLDVCRQCHKPMRGFTQLPAYEGSLNCLNCNNPLSKKLLSLDGLFLTSPSLLPIITELNSATQEVQSACLQWQLKNKYEFELLNQSQNRNLIKRRTLEMLLVANNPRPNLARYGAPSGIFTCLLSRHGQGMSFKANQSVDEIIGRFRTVAAEIKAIGRYFQRLLNSICGHSRALRPAFGQDPDNRERRYYLMVSPTHCHCCAVLSMWRAEQCLFFAIMRRMELKIEDGRPIEAEVLAQRLKELNFSAAASYAAFAVVALRYANAHDGFNQLRDSFHCLLDESPAQIYRHKGRPWVLEGHDAWTAMSTAGVGHVTLQRTLVRDILIWLTKLPGTEIDYVTRHTYRGSGIWHEELSRLAMFLHWPQFGL
ncbi:hypothetical protein [Polaromonas sp. JS666]|uniref:hypothetical protein n=1 Tax=Polaromonas sp. (strain JS666 / ATCC BAA-500) TaxID=296591 RepID=UPI0011139F93|nr:hypothetical protein [Polaromonas sp. JS666]